MARLTFWYEFASTYSYLTAMRIEGLCHDAGVGLAWRPFLLGPIFHAQGWQSSPFNIYPAKGAYMWRDMDRMVAQRGLPPLVRPDPFPQNSLLAARIASMGAATQWGPEFTRAVFTAQFAQGKQISDPDVLADLLYPLGQDGRAMVTQAQTDQSIKDALRKTTKEAQNIGIFGAPSLTTRSGELFWGDDRLEQAIDWAKNGPPKII